MRQPFTEYAQRIRQTQSMLNTLYGNVENTYMMSLDMTGAKKVAEQVTLWSKTHSTDLYHKARESGIYEWEVLEELDPSPRNLEGKIIAPHDAMERCL